MVITGVIRPPPDIRAVADRTASYVAKNGRAFESRILKSAKGKTPKFAFLQPNSPFHAYYEDKIKFYETGGDDEEEAKAEETAKEEEKQEPKAPKETVRKKEKTQKASAIDPIAKALLVQRAKIQQVKTKQKEESEKNDGEEHRSVVHIPPPPPLELMTIVAPSNLSASQIETMQLVAQFAAMDGKGGPFLHQLTLREWNNADFSFCQPRHAHFAYFSALVDAYRKILGEWITVGSTKSDPDAPKTVADPQVVLEEAAYRAEFEREIEQQKSQQEDGEIVAIDWHDFVVVETIDFPVDEVVELSMLPPPPQLPSSKAAQNTSAAKAGQDTMDESDDEEEETIRVVPSYTPKIVGTSNPHDARAIDPITGKSVSVADMPEHMRIQLLDPKWAEERKKFQEKQKDSNLVGGDAIVNNISRFAQARGDLFGKSVSSVIFV
jgi:splicing factor 3A subunit 1